MYPELVNLDTSFGLLRVSSYSFFLLIACVVMIAGALFRLRANNISLKSSVIISIGMMLGAIIGARILHTLTNITVYQKKPILMISLDTHGLSLFGSLILICCLGFLIKRNSHFPIWKFSDGMVPFIGIGIAIARIGCFLNGCCFGKVSNLPWALRFPLFSEAHLYQISRGQTNLISVLPVHPTQLYEAIGTLISIFVAMLVQKKKNVDGAGILVFVASFSIVRLITHYMRVFPDSFLGIEPVFPAVYIAVLLFCFMFYNYNNSKSK